MKPINRFEDIPGAEVRRSIWEHVTIVAPYEYHSEVYRLLRDTGEWHNKRSGPLRTDIGKVDLSRLHIETEQCHGPVLPEKQLAKLKAAVEFIIDTRLQEDDMELRMALETLCARGGIELYPEPPK